MRNIRFVLDIFGLSLERNVSSTDIAMISSSTTTTTTTTATTSTSSTTTTSTSSTATTSTSSVTICQKNSQVSRIFSRVFFSYCKSFFFSQCFSRFSYRMPENAVLIRIIYSDIHFFPGQRVKNCSTAVQQLEAKCNRQKARENSSVLLLIMVG